MLTPLALVLIRTLIVLLDSLGEYAALVTAGVLSLDDALKLVSGRAWLMEQRCKTGETGMLAVRMPSDRLHNLLGDYHGLSIACYNR